MLSILRRIFLSRQENNLLEDFRWQQQAAALAHMERLDQATGITLITAAQVLDPSSLDRYRQHIRQHGCQAMGEVDTLSRAIDTRLESVLGDFNQNMIWHMEEMAKDARRRS